MNTLGVNTNQHRPRALPTQTHRFNSSLHQRDSRSALFEGYTGSGADGSSNRRGITPSPSRLGPAGGYGYSGGGGGGYANGTGLGVPNGGGAGGFRPATPNRKGQYSDAVLNELESQNDAQVEGILGKVRVLKDVRRQLIPFFFLSFGGMEEEEK